MCSVSGGDFSANGNYFNGKLIRKRYHLPKASPILKYKPQSSLPFAISIPIFIFLDLIALNLIPVPIDNSFSK